ncbi:FkbM family methyltransferase [Magnetospirillum sp. UT-4]|uniref:FkbM family methyltransferase n=1 Tax=Magnetospirillum sp. UT-4 TaxID=2681467 RepID=UPI001382B4B0|nr:FkbM family methyltransferase [Magnetospirillum sp. UT-4]CAA7612101.1 putative FkbM family methyltransferase [Magnetospirillum sp. UT-4]
MNASDQTMPWLRALMAAGSAGDLRASLLAAHPGLSSGHLRRVAVVGARDEGRAFVSQCQHKGIEVAAWCDDNPALLGTTEGTATVVPVSRLDGLERSVPVIVASHRGRPLRTRLKGDGFAQVELLSLLQVMEPDVFQPHMFFVEWLERTVGDRDRIARLAGRLGDDASRRALDAFIAFRLTVDPDHFVPVVDHDLYFPQGLFTFTGDEVYVDAGTFDGDSIRMFIDRVGGRYQRVIGFEPDPNTFAALAANFRGEPRVEPINKGLWSETGVLRFRNDASRGSILDGDGGTIEVPVTSLDDVLAGGRVTYVKMNIEGAEIAALNGAREAIRAWKPRLAISVYHRPSDLCDIFELIDAIRPDYRFFLRQQDEGVIESVLYALP